MFPGLAHDADVGSAATPFSGVQWTPSSDVDTWMLIVWLGAAKFWVAKP